MSAKRRDAATRNKRFGITIIAIALVVSVVIAIVVWMVGSLV
jgi:hypothetical protein